MHTLIAWQRWGSYAWTKFHLMERGSDSTVCGQPIPTDPTGKIEYDGSSRKARLDGGKDDDCKACLRLWKNETGKTAGTIQEAVDASLRA